MFQANVINGNSLEFDALIYPTAHQNTLNYIQNSMAELPRKIVGGAAQQLVTMAQNAYAQLMSSETRMRVMNALSGTHNLRNENRIYSIKTIEECQQATLTMQRWIMAEPTVRQMYHDQLCDGYSDTYVDTEPNKIGEDHYDYRRVMTGVVDYDEKTDYMTSFYMDHLKDGDRDLEPHEQLLILENWRVVQIAMSQMNDDPTSPFKGKL